MSPPVDDLVTGLKVLRDVENATVDVIAIHGIGAHPDLTWTDKDAEDQTRYISCLTDERMIPKVLPTARILRFGYKSEWFGDPVISTLTTIGDKLTYALEYERSQKCEDRPIIFISHCFGGLVVLRALTHRFRHHIFEATAGVIFLGTPFRGTHEWFHAQLPKLAVGKLECVKEDILHTLNGQNPTLIEVVDDFNKMRSDAKRVGFPKVACFFEEKPSKVGQILKNGKPKTPIIFNDTRDHDGFDTARIKDIVIVDQHSACLDLTKGVEKYSFQRDHFHLNKFSSPDEADFKELAGVLTRFAESATKDITPDLKNRHKVQPLLQAHFNENSWKEPDQFEDFDCSDSEEKVYHINIPYRFFDSYRSSGLSLNCEYAYFYKTNSVHIYKLSENPARIFAKLRPKISDISEISEKEKTVAIRDVSLGRTASATIINNSCFLHRFIDGSDGRFKAIFKKRTEDTWDATCVAISETTDAGDLILVAIGFKVWTGEHKGRIELYSIWQNDWNQISKIETIEIKDTVTGKSDAPRTLNFSLDGAVLVCTTSVSNQVHGWRLPTTEVPGTLEHLCETSRQFEKGMNADGITSATAFLTPSSKPYVLCTTSPSSERKRNEGHEWTFISPLTKPFPPWESSAFHCLTQVQRQESPHRHIHGCAISPQGNLAALVDKQGHIVFIPLETNSSGGIISSPKAHVAKADLGNNTPSMIAIRFNDQGTKLYGINRAGKVVIIEFPKAREALPLPVMKRGSLC